MTPLPVVVVTGALGAGKTTAIARLFAGKPPEQHWVVLLNEFTQTGVDALNIASQAQGSYDVRVVPNGCLCCTGEAEFTATLRALLRGTRPERLIIEPSGIGHPAAIVDHVLAHQARGALRLDSVVCLVDPARLDLLAAPSERVEYAQADVADALVLSKPDLATAAQRQQFRTWAAGFYPAKRYIGETAGGALPTEALALTGSREARFLPLRNAEHAAAREADATPIEPASPLPAAVVERDWRHALGHVGGGWVLSRDLVFARPRIAALLSADDGPLASAIRVKGVLRTGVDRWLLVQRTGSTVTLEESNWRRDSRFEVMLSDEATVAALEAVEAALLGSASAPG